MTHEEKAKQLVEKMIENSCTPHPDDYYGNLWEVHTEKAKDCAIICCSEILNELVPSDFKDEEKYTTQKIYWQQVKEAINKL